MNEQSYGYGATKSSIRELAAYAAARKAEIGAENVFDFSLGNPSIPAPDQVRMSIIRALTLPATQLHGYTPAAGLPEVRSSIATSLCRRFGEGAAAAGDLYLTCGAAACLSICMHALLNPGDEVIVIAPYFPEYRVWIETAGAVCVEVAADEATSQPDVAAIADAITSRTRAVIVNSPNNPTGAVYTRDVLEQLAAVLAQHDIVRIADEPYRELVYDDVEVPWIPAIYDRTLVCYSYSKSLSLPGERIGWVLVPPAFPDHDRTVAAVAGAGRKLGFVCAPALFQRVIAEFNERAIDLYDDEGRRNGGIEAEDRYGVPRFFPFVTLGVGALTVTPSLCERIRPEDIASAAAHVKHKVKHGNLSLVTERYNGGALPQLVR